MQIRSINRNPTAISTRSLLDGTCRRIYRYVGRDIISLCIVYVLIMLKNDLSGIRYEEEFARHITP